ncbi:hypothetical protein [Flavobacterium sp.]|uniref:hypothetical protein n=1 Tax=Flavobacterium sp. TaxID=239 RepID=UPI003D12A009
MKRKAIAILIICSIIVSCKKEEKTVNEVKKDNNKTYLVKKLDSVSLLYKTTNKDNTEEIRITSYEPSENDKYFLVGNKNFILVSKYLKKGNDFKLIKKDTLVSNEFTYTRIDEKSFQKIIIANKEYILLSVNETVMGNAVTDENVTFIMLDIKTLHFYKLDYTGEPTLRSNEAIDGEFIENESLNSNPEIKKILYQFAHKSKWVFHNLEDENHYTNYVQKWETDNDVSNHLANGSSGIADVIYSTYYKDNLFNYTGKYDEEESIENNDFKIVSYFRSNIIAFDKNKKMYFPIYTETCATGCDKKIRFISENSIEVKYHEYSPYPTSIINLDEIIFKN